MDLITRYGTSKCQAIQAILRVLSARTCSPAHTVTAQPLPSAKSIQSDITSSQSNDSFLKIHHSTSQRILEDSVSIISIEQPKLFYRYKSDVCSFSYLYHVLNLNFCIADKPFMQPRKDYDDYTKFINDTYTEEKINMLNKTVSIDASRANL